MRKDLQPLPDCTLVAYLFRDVSQDIQVIGLTPEVQVEPLGYEAYDLRRQEATLPERFFGKSISSIIALIGKNSSGKSTALADIARILCGNRPVTSACSLVLEQAGRMVQLRYGRGPTVSFAGQGIPEVDPADAPPLKIVYFSSSYDPLKRHRALIEPGSEASMVDISSQAVYSRYRSRGDDFEEKLQYLQAINNRGLTPLELTPEDKHRRSISFTATVAYPPGATARRFFEFLLEKLPRKAVFDRLCRTLREALDMSPMDFARQLDAIRVTGGALKHSLWSKRIDHLELLQNFLSKELSHHPLTSDRFVLLMAIGRWVSMLDANRTRQRPGSAVEALADLFKDPDDAIERVLGSDFLFYAETFAARNFLDVDEDDGAIDEEDEEDDEEQALPYFEVRIEGSAGLPEEHMTYYARRNRELLNSFIALRQKGVEFVVDFNGLSDGQRSLLSFAARYHAQEVEKPSRGNTLLLIDEHEQGLHPEWQRQFVKQLCALVQQHSRSAGRTQVILSSHSPFVVSDLPGSCVNIVGGPALATERTFGGNLLELLLSPLFMERTTGEFAAEKIQEWLRQIRKARSSKALETLKPLVALIGDTLLRSYLELALQERFARLDQNTKSQRHD